MQTELEIDDLLNRYSTKEMLGLLDDDDIIQYCIDELGYNRILSEISDDIVADHVSDFRFVAYDDDHAIEVLRDSGLINNEWSETKVSSKIRKSDCIEIINDIIETKGWDYLYNLIEEEKLC